MLCRALRFGRARRPLVRFNQIVDLLNRLFTLSCNTLVMAPRYLFSATSILTAALLAAFPQTALAQKARISDLSDVTFGTVTNLSSDVRVAQNLCAFTQSATSNYLVTATGGGAGGAFAMVAGSAQLAYEVEWASSPNQTTGIALSAGIALTGLNSSATQQTCNAGSPSSASLIVIIRASQLGAALAGSYSGALSLMIAPE